MSDITLSFAHGNGDMDHNARRKNGNYRAYGQRNRRPWNVTLVERDVDAVLDAQFGTALRAYNAKQIASRHPERCKTMDDWVKAQRRGGRPYTEYVVQLGNRLTGCPYEWVTDEQGNMVATDGTVIFPWQTRKTPAPLVRDGKLHMSDVGIRLRKFYRSVFDNWSRWNPNMVVVGAYIHCDERGGVHMHIDAVCVSKTKNGIGLGIGVTGCIQQMLDKQGIGYGKTRKDNAQKVWTKLMRERLTELAMQHGYNIIDGHCAGRKHRTVEQYIAEENVRNEMLDRRQQELDARTRKQAWLADELEEMQQRLQERESALTKRAAVLSGLEHRNELLRQREEVVAANRFAAEQVRAENKRMQAAIDKQLTAIKADRADIQRAREDAERNKALVEMIRREHPELLEQIEQQIDFTKKILQRKETQHIV